MTRAHKNLVRIGTFCTSLAPALALAHPGHGEHASWQYAVGYMLVGAGLIAAVAAAIRLLTRATTAAAPRSPT
jgi:hypothetical protein